MKETFWDETSALQALRVVGVGNLAGRAGRASGRASPANATALVSSVVKMPMNLSQDGRWLTCPHSGEAALVNGASATASAIRPAGLNMMPVGRR